MEIKPVVGGARVRLGCWVQVRDGQLEEDWRIVPAEEADAMRRRISEQTPLARALLGHQVGDQVRVDGPEGRRVVAILSVA
jgi:transcription elongation factor GreA